MKVYFDMCSIQRPLDDTSQSRIFVEAQAMLGLLALCESGEVDIVSSEALFFECHANPDPLRREFATRVITEAKSFVAANDDVKRLARNFETAGIKPLDALHLASAETGGADFFCTCDDRLLKKARVLKTSAMKVVSPLELISELEA